MSNVPPPMRPPDTSVGSSVASAGNAPSSPIRWIVDGAIATALCVALVVVYFTDSGQSAGGSGATQPGEAEVTVSQTTEQGETKETSQPRKLRIAVTEPASSIDPSDPNVWRQYDDMGALLRELGEGYEYTPISMDDLLDSEKLSQYDVVFLTCGTDVRSWLQEAVGSGARGSRTYSGDPVVIARLQRSLKNFANQGGTLYASDWRYIILDLAFELTAGEDLGGETQKGEVQELDAEIVLPALQEFLRAKTIRLRFDQPGWYPADLGGERAKVLLRGNYRTMLGHQRQSPLLVQIPYGEGSIIFTSFHNESQNSEIELDLLKYLVFTTVTARVETQITKTMVEGGFSPQKQNLLSASQAAQSVTQKYQCDQDGTLRFLLGFEDQGARLKLTVTSPDGLTTKEQEGTSTFSIEIPSPARGEWSYAVEALKVPFADFPFRLQVWQQ